ncbi:hypothetical protein J7E99_02765 [Streptomyces sp. ISL-44]|uniref:hypothetical protein n=1 Tax=Streptomyces sp. ISL-44 TaxID=2819184 RepID=UPI001BEA03D4|nr:hypothetical protein [Streptomyces sp. ISL-44]MBT2539657.1 hypothetical protein [Streptomyces sp. ISL-44]
MASGAKGSGLKGFSRAEVRQAAEQVRARAGRLMPLRQVSAGAVVTELLAAPNAPRLKEADRDQLRREVKKFLAAPARPRRTAQLKRTYQVRQVGSEASPEERTVTLDSALWQQSIGPVYPTSEARSLLGDAPQQLRLRTRRRRILALRTRDGHTVYPAFQFSGRQVLPGLDFVLHAFPDDDPDLYWTIASWMRKPLTTLGDRCVVDTLRDGDIDAAVQAARATASRWSR